MKFHSALNSALDALMHVDSLCLVKKGQSIMDGVFLSHRTATEDKEVVHVARIWYSDPRHKPSMGSPVSYVELEVMLFPTAEAVNFDKLPGISPDEDDWNLTKSSLNELKEARDNLTELIGYFERM